jgi:DNA-binding response OmpR family regulator
MPRVLTVDDSRLIRTLVMKQAQELGCTVSEAEDGEQALARLDQQPVDLIVLDVTMPVLDGPGMIAQLRARHDQTPVLMLTSDSTRQVVMELMKHGITDYILKPFRPEELSAKIRKILRLDATPVAPVALPPIDVLLVDAMENVEKRLRMALPATVSLEAARDPQQALRLGRERRYGVIVIDGAMTDEGATSLMKQLRVLLPKARFVSLHLRTATKAHEESRGKGFDGALFKPFQPEEIEDFLAVHLSAGGLLSRDGDVLRAAACRSPSRQERYFAQLTSELAPLLEAAAAECFDLVVFDASAVPANPDKLPRLVRDLRVRADKLGLGVVVVAPEAVAKSLAQVTDTADVKVFASVEAAKQQQVA